MERNMEIWSFWITFIANSIDYVSTYFGVSQAIAIILFTLLARLVLMPISLKSSYEMHKNKQALEKVRPEIEQLKQRYKNNPAEIRKRTLALYKQHKIKFLDRSSILNIVSQGSLGLGVFQTLKNATLSSKFIWITNITKPDLILAFIVGALTFMSMLMMPSIAEQQSVLLFLIPAVISTIVLLSFPSALGLYWAASNVAAITQTLVLRTIIARQSKAPNNG